MRADAAVHVARKVAVALVLLAWVGLFAAAWIRTDGYQWDFKCYYDAVQAFEHGANPYDPLKFYYPLSALYLFKPLGALDYVAAHRLWVVLKLVSLIALMALWKRVFLPRAQWLLLLVVGMLAFRAAGMVDVKAGNISIFEQLLLWTGLAFLLKSRFGAFAACVVAASVCKLLPAALLLLLLLPSIRSRANTVRMIGAFAALGVLTLLPFLRHPDYLRGFVEGLRSEAPLTISNPSAAAAVADLGRRVPLVGSLQYALLAVYYVVLFAVSRGLIRSAYRSTSIGYSIQVAVFLYAMLAPRLLLYSYLILIVPLFTLVIPAVERMGFGRYAVVAALCAGGLHILPGAAGDMLDDLVPFLLMGGCWAAVIVAQRAGRLTEAD